MSDKPKSWTVTGRAPHEPRLQNVPIRTELGQRIRRELRWAIPNVWLEMNFSELELWIWRSMGGDTR